MVHLELLLRETRRRMGNNKKPDTLQSYHYHRFRELLADTKDCVQLPRLPRSGAAATAPHHDGGP